MSIEINASVTDVVASTLVEVGAIDTSVLVDTSASKIATVIPSNYVLSSGGMYSGTMSPNGIPQWLSDAITIEVLNGTLEYNNLLNTLGTLLNSLSLGVTQNITQIENTSLSLSTFETAVVSRLDLDQAAVYTAIGTKVTPLEATAIAIAATNSRFASNEAKILDLSMTSVTAVEANALISLAVDSRFATNESNISTLFATKVTGAEATALALSAVSSRFATNEASILNLSQTRVTASEVSTLVTLGITSIFGVDASAYVNSRITTYANANLATASSVSLLAAEYNNLSVSITSMEEVYAGVYQQWDGIVAPTIGMFKFVGTIQYQYLGGLLGENNDGWVRTDKSASTTADQAVTWAAGASKLITAPDGSVTGWSFGDGSSTKSEFKIKAQNFSISDGVTGYTPFSISGSDINFNGAVSINKIPSSVYIGSFTTTPSTVSATVNGVTYTLKDGDTYKNSSNSIMYYKSGTSWLSTQGLTGLTGSRGSAILTYVADLGTTTITAALTNVPTYWNTAAQVSQDTEIVGDQLIVTNSNTTSGWTNIYNYDGTSWVSATVLTVNGSAVVTGTLSVDKITPSATTQAGAAVFAIATGDTHEGGLFGFGSKFGVFGKSTSAGGYGVDGSVTNYLSAAGVYGQVLDTNTLANYNTSAPGVKGRNEGKGPGVYGDSVLGYGVYGTSPLYAVYGSTTTGQGVKGAATTGWAVNGEATGTAGIGVRGSSTTAQGVYGIGATYDFYAAGTGVNYGPFTGGHDAFILNTSVAIPGDIVSMKQILFTNGISQTSGEVELSSIVNDKRVFGIYNTLMDLNSAIASMSIGTDLTVLHNMQYIGVNALGEGMINVCSANGNITNGDYITSSSIPGKGIKQDDDIMHSYTVAKALESVDWSTEPSTTKMISCTYHCG